MHLKMTVRVGLALAALTAISPAIPAMAAPAKTKTTQKRTSAKPAPKAPSKPAPKASSKSPSTKVVAVGKTPTETVDKLIRAMQRKDREAIASAFNWKRFADEMNSLIPGEKGGLDPGTYEILLVETLDVEKSVSSNLRVGKETRKGSDLATVEMRRVFPTGNGKSGSPQVRTINILSLAKEKDGWRIYRLDSAQPAAAAPPSMVPHAPQGMVPAAGSERQGND